MTAVQGTLLRRGLAFFSLKVVILGEKVYLFHHTDLKIKEISGCGKIRRSVVCTFVVSQGTLILF